MSEHLPQDTSDCQKETVRQFIEITNVEDEALACSLLQAEDYDLDVYSIFQSRLPNALSQISAHPDQVLLQPAGGGN